jgi:chromosome segregation ATPase
MQVLDRQTTASSPASAPLDGVRIKLCSTGQLKELPRGKTTIGSSPRCNIRLQEPGIQPLHCLIVRDGQNLTVRRWAGETLLNGQRLDESPLAVGDSLQVGAVELEVVHEAQTTAAKVAPVAKVTTPTPAPVTMKQPAPASMPVNTSAPQVTSRAQIEQSQTQEKLVALREELQLAVKQRETAANELRAAAADLAAARQRIREQESAIVVYQPLALQNDKLTRRAQELETRLGELTEQLKKAEAERQALTERASALSADIEFGEAEIARLTERNDELSAQNGNVGYERASLQERIGELQANLDALAGDQGQLDERLQLVLAEKQASEHERHGLSEKVASVYAELEAAATENSRLQQTNLELSNQVADVCSQRDELQRRTGELQANVQSLDEEKRSIEQERQMLADRVGSVSAELVRVEAERSRLQQLMDELSNQHTMAHSEREQLVFRNAEIAQERESLHRQCEELRANLDSLAAQKVELESAYRLLVESDEVRSAELRETQAEIANLRVRQEELESKVWALTSERDEISRKCDGLESQLQAVSREFESAELDRRELTTELTNSQEYREHLQVELQAANCAKSAADEKHAELAAECERLRGETGQMGELERKLREAVADRESTSSELYNALLQLAEVQERDEHNQTFASAQQALRDELDKSAIEVADLTAQVERLAAQHANAEAARAELAQQQSATAEAQVQLANEKMALEESLADLRDDLATAKEREAAARQREAAAQEREAEFAAQVQVAEEWRRKYEQLAAKEAALTEAVAALQAQLENQAASDSNSEQLFAQHQESIAEYEQQIAAATESVARLEEQLTEAASFTRTFEQSRHEWNSERAELEGHTADLMQQVSELEARLSEALQSRPISYSQSPVNESVDAEKATAEAAWESKETDMPASVMDWSARDNSEVDAFATPSEPEAPAENVSWGQTPATNDWATPPQDESTPDQRFGWGTEEPANEPGFESTAGWGPESRFQSPAGDAFESPREEATPEPAAFQSAPSAFAAAADPASAPKAEPTSFIERYSHLFADDKPAADAASLQPELRQPLVDDRRPQQRTSAPANTVAPLSGDDEESIEQYMSKLLQRVRGDEQPAESTAKPQITPAMQAPSGPLGYEPSPMQAEKTMSLSAISLRDSLINGESTASLDGSPRKASMPAPQTDLEALRALANESARRAISRHSFRKYRRNALTKMIVSTLAGVTSLWLMLESPGWLDMQFIAACVSMAIAAYWGAETFRTLLESFRIAAKDETEVEIEEISAELKARLPIDAVGESK